MVKGNCVIDNCTRRQHAHGWCDTHYQRWRKYGSTDLPAPPSLTELRLALGRRLLSHLKQQDDCLVWTGTVGNAGYGLISTGGRQGKTVLVHRLAYELWVGPIPEGLTIDHVRARGCRSKLCCEPAHLEPVTLLENIRRGPGSNQHCRKGHLFTPETTLYSNLKDGTRARQCKPCTNEHRRERYRSDAVYRAQVNAASSARKKRLKALRAGTSPRLA